MLSEDFDKKIKEAADQHHPAYDEKAWKNMEKLLNQHLPQQKGDRRRILLLLLLLFLVGGGAYMILSKPLSSKSASAQIVQENKTKIQPAPVEKSKSSEISFSNNQPDKTNQKAGTNETIILKTQSQKINGNRNIANSLPEKNSQNQIVNKPRAGNDRNDDKNIASLNNVKKDDKNTFSKGNEAGTNEQKVIPGNNKEQTPANLSAIDQKNIENKTTNSSVAANEITTNKTEPLSKTDAKKSLQQKKKLPGKNGFGLFVSAGPDVSKAGESKTGKTTLLYGAGISYTRNRFTLRTGIFASKKIYWAGYNDYQISFSTTPPTKFIGANADCDVLDIPVKLSYSFKAGNKSNWFAGAGLSSYLMKKEKYVFIYKSASTTYYYPYQTKNESKHYFSILNLSAGYTRKINNTVSITAEPYAEIPLTGIGIGRVHLNSGGILFTVGVNPFKK